MTIVVHLHLLKSVDRRCDWRKMRLLLDFYKMYTFCILSKFNFGRYIDTAIPRLLRISFWLAHQFTFDAFYCVEIWTSWFSTFNILAYSFRNLDLVICNCPPHSSRIFSPGNTSWLKNILTDNAIAILSSVVAF